MRIAYLDCFAGISGDMFLAALLDAGLDPAILHDAAAAMNLNVMLKIDRRPLRHLEQEGPRPRIRPPRRNRPTPTPPHPHPPAENPAPPQDRRPHTHEPASNQQHSHGRSLSVIRDLIKKSSLAWPVKHTAIHAFELLGASEAKIHNVPLEQIHFHEVGAVDAIIDIVAASAGIHALAADKWFSSPVNVGGGSVDCAHGRFPVPAPATADLLRGLPTYSAAVLMELVTPTGAALLRVLVEENHLTFGLQPAMRVEQIGYGAGTRDPKDFPNVLRLSIGESGESGESGETSESGTIGQTVTVLETALDDLSPQILAYVTETALAQGALDVMLTPVIMKKGRPGTLITILANPQDSHKFEQLLLRETSTLGVRIRQDRRSCLERAHATVDTPYGPIRIKIGTLAGNTLNANPEYEDCRTAAATHQVALKQVQQAALAAYLAAAPTLETQPVASRHTHQHHD